MLLPSVKHVKYPKERWWPELNKYKQVNETHEVFLLQRTEQVLKTPDLERKDKCSL